MKYQEAIDFLYGALPMFQRSGKSAFKKDLKNILSLCHSFENPQCQFKSVHIAGTNGKGSSSHMLASILQEAGYKVGLYTSPHLKNFTERIRINGREISEQSVVSFVIEQKYILEYIQPSFFEMTVIMAFDYFAKQKVDIAVIEVGLGGRLDSTNVIQPEACLITNIGMDHMDMLGNTLPLIAAEKAGIIKHNTPVVISETHHETLPVFIDKAKQQDAKLIVADQQKKSSLKTSLKGPHQQKNLQGVVTLVGVLRSKGWKISEEHIENGLVNVMSNTGLKGRWQVLNSNPLTICDTGHNKDALQYVVGEIRKQSYTELYLILGFVEDKDVSSILGMFPKAHFVFTKPNIPRGLSLKELKETCSELGIEGEYVEDVNEAIGFAKSKAHSSDMIFIGGSSFVVAEIEGL